MLYLMLYELRIKDGNNNYTMGVGFRGKLT
jgi:hypothetical protein